MSRRDGASTEYRKEPGRELSVNHGEEKKIVLFARYLREKAGLLLLLAVFVLIFAVVFSLYRLPVEAVGYAALWCVLVGIAALFLDYRRYVKKHRKRSEMLELPATLLLEELLAENDFGVSSMMEKDYTGILNSVLRGYRATVESFQQEKQDTADYYTTWVHQVKTPIAAMKLTLQAEDTGEHRQLLAELFRMEQYVEMVLMYLRLDSESSDLVLARYSLDHIIRQAVHQYAHEFVRRKLSFSYEGTDLQILTDEKWLLFIVGQVLSNALKYTHSGGIKIEVTEDAVLTVRDTGIGIAEEDLPRIFEKGYTGYNGRADKESTGLGLYLCRRTAAMLGHRIWAESEVGVGTTIFLDLSERRVDTTE